MGILIIFILIIAFAFLPHYIQYFMSQKLGIILKTLILIAGYAVLLLLFYLTYLLFPSDFEYVCKKMGGSRY